MKFGYTHNHFEFGQKSGITHCPRCMRSKDEALMDQLNSGQECDDERCVFKKEIKQAIESLKEMNYCINCGNKIRFEDNYCMNCGVKIEKNGYYFNK